MKPVALYFEFAGQFIEVFRQPGKFFCTLIHLCASAAHLFGGLAYFGNIGSDLFCCSGGLVDIFIDLLNTFCCLAHIGVSFPGMI